ncbi:hypothetical protein [Hyalangium rubrum]|uniref:Uncharacterized protein n=1 Tax=Hyalangium rubrum TaxID=3103134 RepID=A0ABU5HHU8_9BACT|nr:hypothetical protein [Hyalangium sp. s54d21]MDY7232407.1 hypothetical protein [Hyalangium sp. s54d21]
MLVSIASVLLANALAQTPTNPTTAPAPFPYCGMPLHLKSWKGDYLNRTDAAQGVNAAATGTGTVWSVEMVPNQ